MRRGDGKWYYGLSVENGRVKDEGRFRLLSVRMTGCPNGCARRYQSDIGIVGRSGDRYALYVVGGVLGQRLNFVLGDLVPRHQIVPTLARVLQHFKQHRHDGEAFGDYCQRRGAEKLQALLAPPCEAAPSGPALRRTVAHSVDIASVLP